MDFLHLNSQIYIFPYEIKAKSLLNSFGQMSTEGCLIRWQDAEGVVSYSDCPLLKKVSLEFSLENLVKELKKCNFSFSKQQFITNSTSQCADLIKAQWQLASLFLEQINLKKSNISKVENNYLVTNEALLNREFLFDLKEQGYRKIKVKMKSSFEENLKILIDLTTTVGFDFFKWRLDFNAGMNGQEAIDLFENLSPDLLQFIDYVEDPCVFDTTTWSHLNKILPVAIDLELSSYLLKPNVEEAPFQYLIFKPSLQNFENLKQIVLKNNLKVVVTSSMQGPLGVYQDAMYAQKLSDQNIHVDKVVGCGTLHLFENLNPFESMKLLPALNFPMKDLIINFEICKEMTEILETLSWKPL